MLLLLFFSILIFVPIKTIPPDPLAYPGHTTLRCPWAHFDCDPRSITPFCIPFGAVRNCIKDCPNGADEFCGVGQVLCDIMSRSFPCGQCVPIQQQKTRCLDTRWTHMCNDPIAIKCASTPNCVIPQWLKDGRDDCGDGSDEDPCGRGIIPCAMAEDNRTTTMVYENVTESFDLLNSTGTTPFTIPEECETGEYRCGSGECIDGKMVLDEKKDCSDGSDEDYCIRFGSECRVDSRPCSYQPDIASFGCGCPRGNTRTEEGICTPK